MRKTVLWIAIFTLLLISPITSLAQSKNPGDIVPSIKSAQEEVTSTNTIIRVLGKVLINVAGNIRLSNHPGYVTNFGSGKLYVTHPNVKFNTGSINTQVKKEVTAYGQDVLRPFMQKNQLFVGNAQILVFNHNGSKVLDRSVASGRTVDYKIPGGYNTRYNGYHIYYGSNNKENWYTRMYYINNGQPCTQCIPSSLEDPHPLNENLVLKNDRIYIKQSNLDSVDLKSNKKDLTMNDIFNEFYDNNTKKLTNQTRTLDAEDEVSINDVIAGLKYNSEYDYTEFQFKSEHSTPNYHSIMFQGNLSSRYSPGDSLNLLFKLKETENVNGDIFVDLNYNIQVEDSNKFPVIDNFIK